MFPLSASRKAGAAEPGLSWALNPPREALSPSALGEIGARDLQEEREWGCLGSEGAHGGRPGRGTNAPPFFVRLVLAWFSAENKLLFSTRGR